MGLLTSKEIVKSLRHLERDSKSFANLSHDFADTLAEVKRFGFDAFIEALRMPASKLFTVAHLLVPFTAVLEPVSRRMHVLSFLFLSCMEMRQSCISVSNQRTFDERLRLVASEVKAFIKTKCLEFNAISQALVRPLVLSSEKIDKLLVALPPCMLHLHKQLRSVHRLRHHSRVQYTLFLKDVGMPVEESLNFWSAEFSIPCKDSKSGCKHNWSADKRRYTYNILHLYGLAGSRRNYTCRSCQSLQNDLTYLQNDCGCPFRCFDDEKLQQFLLSSYPLHVSTIRCILRERAEGRYSGSCALVKQAVCASNALQPPSVSTVPSRSSSLSCIDSDLGFKSNCSLPNLDLSYHNGFIHSRWAKVNDSAGDLSFNNPVGFFIDVLNSVELNDSGMGASSSY
uniref:DNA primase large subunit n=1 Tax=Trichuris muris TaxID=70415 RepID=A0A5S6R0R1_TRIMR